MKNLYKFMVVAFFLTALVGCEEEKVLFDSENGPSFATFQEPSPADLIINPAAETENVYNISVSTVSSSDRAVSISVDEESTLDPSFYNIDNLNPVIPAGEFSTSVTITTPATSVFPASGSSLILNLDSVEGAEIAEFSTDSYEIPYTVQCPEVDMASIPGTYAVTSDAFGFVISESFEIVEGPGENEFTLVNLSGHTNPDSGEADYEVVIEVDPGTGEVSVERQGAWHYDTFGGDPDYGEGRVEGTGLVLTCINQINFSLTHTVDAGSFGTYGLTVEKL